MRLTKAQAEGLYNPGVDLGKNALRIPGYPDRQTGRTELLAIKAIRSALTEPGRQFVLQDHAGTTTVRVLADRVSTYIHKLGLTEIVLMDRFGAQYAVRADPSRVAEWLERAAFTFKYVIPLPPAKEEAHSIDDVAMGRAALVEKKIAQQEIA